MAVGPALCEFKDGSRRRRGWEATAEDAAGIDAADGCHGISDGLSYAEKWRLNMSYLLGGLNDCVKINI